MNLLEAVGAPAELVTLVWGARVRGERKARAWKQDDLAAASNCTQTFVSRLERGAIPDDNDALLRIAGALGVPAGEMFPRRRRSDPPGLLTRQPIEAAS